MKWFPIVALLSACHANATAPIQDNASAARIPVAPLVREGEYKAKLPTEKWVHFKAVPGGPDSCSDAYLREYFGEPLKVLSRAPAGRIDWKTVDNGDIIPDVTGWDEKGVRAYARAESLNVNKLGERTYTWVQESKWWDFDDHLQGESVSVHFRWDASGKFLLGIASIMRVDIGDYCLEEGEECDKTACVREVVPL
jgi:hypothetical protein